MIYVFLNNKLITIDTIIPLICYLKEKLPQVQVTFISFHQPTYLAIKENVIIWNAIKQTGRFVLFSKEGTDLLSWIRHKTKISAYLIQLLLRVLLGNAVIFHFKALNNWPLRFLFLASRTRTYLFQGSNSVVTKWELQAAEILSERRYPTITPAAGRIVGFDQSWAVFSDPRLNKVNRYVIPRPFQLTIWQQFLRREFESHLRENCPSVELDSDHSFGVFILSSMDHAPLLTDPDSFPELFAETLDCLKEVYPDLPILIKPHPATTPHYKQIRESILEKRSDRYLNVVHLHPLLLAMRARFFIGNIFSSTFIFAHSVGVPTIEYTDYCSEMMDVTGGKSMQPDLVTTFINRNSSNLVEALQNIGDQNSGTKLDEVSTSPALEALTAELGRQLSASDEEN